jgi:hypothetical protein
MSSSQPNRDGSRSLGRSKSRRRSTSSYHDPAICGDNFHKLAKTIQSLIRQNSFAPALQQLRRCIAARIKSSESREGGGDTGHKHALYAVRQLLQQVLEIGGHNLDYITLAGIQIEFIDTDRQYNFYIHVPLQPQSQPQTQPQQTPRGRQTQLGGSNKRRKTKKNRK